MMLFDFIQIFPSNISSTTIDIFSECDNLYTFISLLNLQLSYSAEDVNRR